MILLRAYDLEPFDLPYFTCFLYFTSSVNFTFALCSPNDYNISDIFFFGGKKRFVLFVIIDG